MFASKKFNEAHPGGEWNGVVVGLARWRIHLFEKAMEWKKKKQFLLYFLEATKTTRFTSIVIIFHFFIDLVVLFFPLICMTNEQNVLRLWSPTEKCINRTAINLSSGLSHISQVHDRQFPSQKTVTLNSISSEWVWPPQQLPKLSLYYSVWKGRRQFDGSPSYAMALKLPLSLSNNKGSRSRLNYTPGSSADVDDLRWKSTNANKKKRFFVVIN